MPNTNQLCGICRQFSSEMMDKNFDFDRAREPPSARWAAFDYTSDLVFEHHENIAKLEASAAAGCSLCRILLADLQERDCNGKLWIYPDFFSHIRFKAWFNEKSYFNRDYRIDAMKRFSWASGLGGKPDLYYRVGLLKPWGASLDYWTDSVAGDEAALEKVTTDDSEPRKKPTWERAIPDSAMSDDALATARYWLQECTSKHEHCTKGERSNKLPTRVIDVGTIEKPHVKLYVPSSEERCAYVALSHCWGGDIPCKLLESNLTAYRQPSPGGFPFDQLPQNFLDAIRLTRALGFRFLWIDALCIIQDSAEDWQREASRMTAAYSDAALTISVLDAQASTDGFLGHRGITQAVIGPGLAIQKELRTPAEALLISPLGYRGWCMQERLLSPALLHVGHDQMYWECWTGVCSETGGPASFAVEAGHCPATRGESVAQVNKLRPRVFGGISQPVPEDWYQLVEEFTSRRLTMVSDKLPAVAGIAQRLCSMDLGRGRYVAGIWEADLMGACFWSARTTMDPYAMQRRPGYDGIENLSRPAEISAANGRVPTWSWASVDGPVEFHNLASKDVNSSTDMAEWPDVLRLLAIEFEACSLNGRHRAGDDFLGNQFQVSLKVRGPLARMEYRPDGPFGVVYLQETGHNAALALMDVDRHISRKCWGLISGKARRIRMLLLEETAEGSRVFRRQGYGDAVLQHRVGDHSVPHLNYNEPNFLERYFDI